MGRHLTKHRPARRHLAPTLLGLVCGVAAADPPVVGQPIFDQTVPALFSSAKQDKLVGDYVFSSYGIGAFGAANVFDTGQKFLGLSFNPAPLSLGGITEACDPTGLTGCAYVGAKATLGGHGTFGTEYQLRAGGGALDVRVPLRATLDLPYDAGGGGVPTLGANFTIGSGWASSVKTLSQPGSGTQSVTPLLATHGPTVQAYADLIGQLGASVGGKICVVDCWSDSISAGLGGRWELGSVNRNGDGKFSVLGQQVNPAGTAMDGIIQYELRLPKLDAQDKTLAASGLGGMLQTQSQDRVLKVDLGIDELVAKLTGVPISGSVGFDAFGEHIGANYALLEAAAGFDTLLRQRVTVHTLPIVRLDFASPVQRLLSSSGGFDLYGAPTQSLSFNLGESITLRNTQASLLGAEASFGMMLAVTSELELEVVAKLSVEALKASTTLGGIGPLYGPESVSVPLGSIPLHQASFAAGVQELGGSYFNMLFKPPAEPLPYDPQQLAALGFYDGTNWKDALGNALCGTDTTPSCTALAQTKFNGTFDLGAAALPPCLFEPDGCAPTVQQELAERLQWAIDAGPLGGQWRESALRLLDEEGNETFLSALAGLNDPLLNLGPGLSDEQFAHDTALMLAAVGAQRLFVQPVSEPGSALLLGLGLAALALRRRR